MIASAGAVVRRNRVVDEIEAIEMIVDDAMNEAVAVDVADRRASSDRGMIDPAMNNRPRAAMSRRATSNAETKCVAKKSPAAKRSATNTIARWSSGAKPTWPARGLRAAIAMKGTPTARAVADVGGVAAAADEAGGMIVAPTPNALWAKCVTIARMIVTNASPMRSTRPWRK